MTTLAGRVAVAAAAVASLAIAAPVANAQTHYYQQQVTGTTKAQCEQRGRELADQKQAEGYLVTWTGCGQNNRGWVSWSDG